MTVSLAKLASAFAALSLTAVGGVTATVPEVRRIVVVQSHWMDDASLSHLFAISQAAPGPNVLLVSLIGWRLAGLAGLLLCTIAINAPSSLLAYAAGKAWNRWTDTPWIGRLRSVLGAIATGLVIASGTVIARSADKSFAAWIITSAVAAFVILTRLNILWALGSAALAGVLMARFGAFV